MRKVFALALLLVAGGAAALWYAAASALGAERAYTAFEHEVASAASARVIDSRFERGWLASRAETSLEVAGGAGLAFRALVASLGVEEPRARVGLRMSHAIEHGPLVLVDWIRGGMEGAPVLARVRSTLRFDHEAQRTLADAVGKVSGVTADTVVRRGGVASVRLAAPAQRLRAAGDGFAREVRFDGVSGTLDLTDGYRRVAGTIQLPGLAARGLERVFAARGVVWRLDVPGRGRPPARMELAIASLALGGGGLDQVLALEDAVAEPSVRLLGGRFEGEATWTATAVAAAGAPLAAPAPVRARVRLALTRAETGGAAPFSSRPRIGAEIEVDAPAEAADAARRALFPAAAAPEVATLGARARLRALWDLAPLAEPTEAAASDPAAPAASDPAAPTASDPAAPTAAAGTPPALDPSAAAPPASGPAAAAPPAVPAGGTAAPATAAARASGAPPSADGASGAGAPADGVPGAAEPGDAASAAEGGAVPAAPAP